MQKKIILLISIFLLINITGFTGCQNDKKYVPKSVFSDEEIKKDNTIYIDYSTAEGVPLFKKTGMFSVGWVPATRQLNTLKELADTRPVTLRMDMGMGYSGMGASVGLGTAEKTKNSFTAMNSFSKKLIDKEVMPYWVYFNIPKAAQSTDSSEALNYDAWKEVCKATAANFLQNNIRLYGHEVGNEPETPEFFKGTFQDYIKMYQYGAAGIREADPDAVVGGLSAYEPNYTMEKGNFQAFLKACTEGNTPLDFVSFHSYWQGTIMAGIQKMKEHLAGYENFNNVRFQITELNTAFNSPQATSNFATAAKFFSLAENLNGVTDIEVSTWALFLSPYDYLGLLSKENKKHAAYHAIKFYNNMPMKRVKVKNNTSAGTIASAEDGRVSLVLYNVSSTDEKINVLLDKIPFKKGQMKEYLINKTHSSYYDTKDSDNLTVIKDEEINTEGGYVWTGNVPKYSTVMIEITAPDSESELNQRPNMGEYVRRDYYFKNRMDNLFAETDLLSKISFVGMNESSAGEVATSLTFDKTVEKIPVSSTTFGDFKAAADGAYCGIRVDFLGTNGYDYSVFYRLGGNGEPLISPVSKEKADKIIDASGDFDINIAEEAPSDFTGRTVITYGIKDFKKSSMAKFTVRESK